MSVPAPQRNESSMDFAFYALELDKFTAAHCKSNAKAKGNEMYVNVIPGCYRDSYARTLIDASDEILKLVIRGNSIYPTNAVEVQERRNCFLRAKGCAVYFQVKLEAAYELIRFDKKVHERWSWLIAKEIGLLTGVLKADQKRYKNIK